MTIQADNSQEPFRIETYDDYNGSVPAMLQQPDILTGRKVLKRDEDNEFLIQVTGSKENIDTYATAVTFFKLVLIPQSQADLDSVRSQVHTALLDQWKDRMRILDELVQVATDEELEQPDTIWQDVRRREYVSVQEQATKERDPHFLRYIQIVPGPNMPAGLYRIEAIIDPPLDFNNSEDIYATNQTGELGHSIKVTGGVPMLSLHKFLPGQTPIVVSSINNSVSSFCPNGGELHVNMSGNPPCSYIIELGIWVQKA